MAKSKEKIKPSDCKNLKKPKKGKYPLKPKWPKHDGKPSKRTAANLEKFDKRLTDWANSKAKIDADYNEALSRWEECKKLKSGLEEKISKY